MALRGKKPTTGTKRLKALFFGEAGAGKTTAAIQFPSPYLIDTEKGAVNDQYVKVINDRGGAVFQSNDFDDIVAEVTSLLSTKHQFRTLILDPITTVYDDLIEKMERTYGTEFGKHYAEAKKRWKRLANLIGRLDMNVIVTSHQKKLYAEGAVMKVIGNTFDGPKGLDYLFDLVFEIAKRGSDRVGIVKKSRVAAFPESDVFPFNYEEVAKRYGKDILERDAVAVALATPEQAKLVADLLETRKDGEALKEAWLKKADAETLAEMPADAIVKCIAFLQGPTQPTITPATEPKEVPVG